MFDFRLISEMTIEENILKKANQKRLMSDVAIEGGNFTTAFFKQVRQTVKHNDPTLIRMLFAVLNYKNNVTRNKIRNQNDIYHNFMLEYYSHEILNTREIQLYS